MHVQTVSSPHSKWLHKSLTFSFSRRTSITKKHYKNAVIKQNLSKNKNAFYKKDVCLSFCFCFWICRGADDSYTTERVYPSGVPATWCAIAPPHFASRAPVVIIRCLVLFAAVQYSKLVNRVACFSVSSSFFILLMMKSASSSAHYSPQHWLSHSLLKNSKQITSVGSQIWRAVISQCQSLLPSLSEPRSDACNWHLGSQCWQCSRHSSSDW